MAKKNNDFFIEKKAWSVVKDESTSIEAVFIDLNYADDLHENLKAFQVA
jgi:hypothetical protein